MKICKRKIHGFNKIYNKIYYYYKIQINNNIQFQKMQYFLLKFKKNNNN